MAVTDFGAGRFAQSAQRGSRTRAYSYEHQAGAYDDDEDLWYPDAATDTEPEPGGLGTRLARLTQYLAALFSVALLVGLVVWGYQLVARDVSGVPVIRAAEGEARSTPMDPGGELAQHEGLTVNEIAGGVGIPPAADIAIAPDATGLAEDDVAMGELIDPDALVALAEVTPLPEVSQPVIALSDADAAFVAGAEDEGFALSQLGIVDPNAVEAAVAEAQEPVAAEPAETAIAAVRPARRPASVAAQAAVAPATVPAAADAAEAPARPAEAPPAETRQAEAAPEPAPAAQPAPGAHLVQIGAFDSDAIANSEWGRISGRYSSLFSGKSPVVQTTERNGRTFYRLRVAGFGSRDDARRFCAALIAEGTDCITAAAQ